MAIPGLPRSDTMAAIISSPSSSSSPEAAWIWSSSSGKLIKEPYISQSPALWAPVSVSYISFAGLLFLCYPRLPAFLPTYLHLLLLDESAVTHFLHGAAWCELRYFAQLGIKGGSGLITETFNGTTALLLYYSVFEVVYVKKYIILQLIGILQIYRNCFWL